MRLCTIDGCDRRHDARGYCKTHYRRLVRYGDPDYTPDARFTTPAPPCAVEGCHRKHQARGYCDTHYARLRRYGDVMADQEVRAVHWEAPLPAGGLLKALERIDRMELSSANQKAITRAKQSGRILPHVADRIAVEVLGTHPALIFGDAWWLAEEMEGVAA